MNLVVNIFMDGCIQVKESSEQLEGQVEEEYPKHSNEITMVLWDMFPSLNLAKDDEVVEEGLPIQTNYHIINKGHVPQQQPIVSQTLNTKKT
jgi:hypothetical protein